MREACLAECLQVRLFCASGLTPSLLTIQQTTRNHYLQVF